MWQNVYALQTQSIFSVVHVMQSSSISCEIVFMKDEIFCLQMKFYELASFTVHFSILVLIIFKNVIGNIQAI